MFNLSDIDHSSCMKHITTESSVKYQVVENLVLKLMFSLPETSFRHLFLGRENVPYCLGAGCMPWM